VLLLCLHDTVTHYRSPQGLLGWKLTQPGNPMTGHSLGPQQLEGNLFNQAFPLSALYTQVTVSYDIITLLYFVVNSSSIV